MTPASNTPAQEKWLDEIREAMQAPGGYRPSTEECRLLLAEVSRLRSDLEHMASVVNQQSIRVMKALAERDRVAAKGLDFIEQCKSQGVSLPGEVDAFEELAIAALGAKEDKPGGGEEGK